MTGRLGNHGSRGARLRRTAAFAVLLVVLASRARAGDYHMDSTLRCSDCHVMHFSQSHDYGRSGFSRFTQLGPLGPNRSLLRNRTNDLCLTCHDNNPLATDVLDAVNSGSQPTAVRLGGYLNREGSAAPHGGHTLDSTSSAPNSTPSWSPQSENGSGVGMECTNCHDPHGAVPTGHPTGSQYRNLRANVGWATNVWVTYNNATPGSNDLTRHVYERQAAAYDESNVDWNEPNSNASAIASWCGGCHNWEHGNRLWGSSNGTSPLDEHPVRGENLDSSMRTQHNSLTNRVKLMSQVGIWRPAGSDVTPTCITCHKSHGNANPRGLIFRSGSGTLTENGDSNGTTQDNLCRQCHRDGAPN